MKQLIVIIVSLFILSGCSLSSREKPVPTEAPPSATQEVQITEEPPATEEPEIVKEPAPVLLAQSETKLLNRENDRVHNILLAAESLDGYELAPGEVFSFNDVVGDRTEEKGYRDAPVYIKGKEAEDCGGGVCQVSTTLYQAADAAGLSIIER
ncbi:MAG: VanW family protein, partial [Clostridia bacterium]|nr:VanW family protein [Clostridia bacterium]